LAWFKRESSEIQANEEKRVRTEGLWVKCEGCRQIIWKKELEDNLNVCTKCDYHFRIDSAQRMMLLLDEDSIETQDEGLESTDPLNFSDTRPYKARLEKSKSSTGLKDAIINATGTMNGKPVIVSAMEYSFIAGGARMMEGVVSLMQMAKISAALARLDSAHVPYISVLTDPTTGGVTASYAMLGDLNIAEPGALIGFAGPRVIEQTIRQKLPEGFQTSEFLMQHGMLDAVVHRKDMKAYITRALDFMTPKAA
jgi:acetyl-CoA carboxylase carboxyl transferase subunit beta